MSAANTLRQPANTSCFSRDSCVMESGRAVKNLHPERSSCCRAVRCPTLAVGPSAQKRSGLPGKVNICRLGSSAGSVVAARKLSTMLLGAEDACRRRQEAVHNKEGSRVRMQ